MKTNVKIQEAEHEKDIENYADSYHPRMHLLYALCSMFIAELSKQSYQERNCQRHQQDIATTSAMAGVAKQENRKA